MHQHKTIKKNISLIGFMASGKTSFGKKLARHLNYNFIDLDFVIEKSENQTINQIFETHGEAYFRKIESEVLKSLPLENSVISVGGGTPCFNNNIEYIKNNSILIYLELSLKILIGRIKQDKKNRPLVKDLNDIEIVEKITLLFMKREKFYKQADLILDGLLSPKKMKELIDDFITI